MDRCTLSSVWGPLKFAAGEWSALIGCLMGLLYIVQKNGVDSVRGSLCDSKNTSKQTTLAAFLVLFLERQ